MYEELIRRLKNAAGGPEGIKMAYKAADAITALQTENAEKDKKIERLEIELRYKQNECDSHYGDFCEAKDTLSRVEAERDAAVKDLCLAGDCDTCYMRGKRGYSQCSPIARDENGTCVGYKWRGAQEEA